MMQALRVTQLGQPPEVCEIETPVPQSGDILLRIEACGLNFADTLLVEGNYQEKPELPFTLGMEVAGTVIGQGPDVQWPAVGARIVVRSSQGGLAQKGIFSASGCVAVPDSVSMEQAAAFQIAYGTSHLALDHRARLQPGERLVVTGAAGGVGLTAVEIGRLMGAEVVAIARGAEKLAVAEAAGAHHLIDATSEDIRGQLKALGGIDVAYDTVGGALWEACFRAARPEARLMPIGFAGGGVPEIKANHLLVKNLTVIGLYWGGYERFAPEILGGSLETLMGWLAEGKLTPHISHVLPLARAAEGLTLIRQRQSTGKVVVTP